MGFIQCTVRCIEIYCKKITFFIFILCHFCYLKDYVHHLCKESNYLKIQIKCGITRNNASVSVTRPQAQQHNFNKSHYSIHTSRLHAPIPCVFVCLCTISCFFYLNKGTVDINHLRRHEEPPCQLSCPEPAIPSLFSLSPPRLPSSSAPLIGPLSG